MYSRRQRAEGRRQRAEGRGQRAEGKRQRTEGFYVYYWYVVVWAVKSVLSFMATGIREQQGVARASSNDCQLLKLRT